VRAIVPVDPGKVLVFGQSAGAFDTCILVTSPLAKGLFSRAAIHSGGCSASSRDTVEANAGTIASRVGCAASADVAGCLRAKPELEILHAATFAETYSGGFYPPNVDGVVIPDKPLATIGAGRHNRVPVVIGTTRNEMETFIRAFAPAPVTTVADYRDALARAFPAAGSADLVLQRYPVRAHGTPQEALKAALADFVFLCPSRRAARAFATAQEEPVFRFVHGHTFESGPLRRLRANHGYELFFVFHAFGGQIPASEAELALSDTIGGYWTRFARSGDPNGDGAPSWPVYRAPAEEHVVFDGGIGRAAGGFEPCAFWDAVAPP